ncbi:MAG TPA: hypothetical protein VM051_00095 [Usitatibacter sp.]|nr:hypothetical protein [Usitatibacter sp.]
MRGDDAVLRPRANRRGLVMSGSSFRNAAIGYACALLSAACAQLPTADHWEEAPSHKALPAVYIEVDAAGIARYCGKDPALYIHGCAHRDFESRACFVFTRARPQQWLLEHEKKHCDGYDHPVTASLHRGLPDLQTAAVQPN